MKIEKENIEGKLLTRMLSEVNVIKLYIEDHDRKFLELDISF